MKKSYRFIFKNLLKLNISAIKDHLNQNEGEPLFLGSVEPKIKEIVKGRRREQRVVNRTVELPIEKLVTFSHDKAYTEFRALFLSSKSLYHIKDIMCVYDADLTPDFKKEFNKILHGDEPDYLPIYNDIETGERIYFKDLKSVKPTKFSAFPNANFQNKLVELSPEARLCLLSAKYLLSNTAKARSIWELTLHETRKFNFDEEKAISELIDTELLVAENSKEKLFKKISKDELKESCSEMKIQCKSSWNKKKLLESLENVNPEFLNDYAKNYKMVKVNEKYIDSISIFRERTYEMSLIFIFLHWYANNWKDN